MLYTYLGEKKKKYENHTQKIGELCFKIAPEMEDGPQAESSKWQQTGVRSTAHKLDLNLSS